MKVTPSSTQFLLPLVDPVHEVVVLPHGAITHGRLDQGAGIPGAVVDEHFPGFGHQLVVVPQPVAHFLGSGYALADDARGPGVEVVGNGRGDAALAGGVPSLQHNCYPLPRIDRPFLQGQQLATEDAQFGSIGQVFDASEGGNVVLVRRGLGKYLVIFQLFYVYWFYVVRNHQKITVRQSSTLMLGGLGSQLS